MAPISVHDMASGSAEGPVPRASCASPSSTRGIASRPPRQARAKRRRHGHYGVRHAAAGERVHERTPRLIDVDERAQRRDVALDQGVWRHRDVGDRKASPATHARFDTRAASTNTAHTPVAIHSGARARDRLSRSAQHHASPRASHASAAAKIKAARCGKRSPGEQGEEAAHRRGARAAVHEQQSAATTPSVVAIRSPRAGDPKPISTACG